MAQKYDALIVGGGAAAMVAAITLGRTGKTTALLERLERVGKKILQTGNGRCNVTNKNIGLKNYGSENLPFVKRVLENVPLSETESFFESIGVILAEEKDGKLFPQSFQASSVLDLLRLEINRLGIEEKTNFFVTDIKKSGDTFTVLSESGEEAMAKSVIIATGGMAAPQMGCDGSGYGLLAKMGHTLISPHPALVQLKIKNPYRALKGVKQDGEVTLFIDGKRQKYATGEFLFTDYGISGPPVFNLSIMAAKALDEGRRVTVSVNFLPYKEKNEAAQILIGRKENLPHLWGEDFLNGIVNKRLGKEIMKMSKNISDVIKNTTQFEVEISGTLSYKNAQTTSGGIDTADFNPDTMESYITPGIFAAGEVLDVVGDCGGYNLQWAWSSGILAGRAAGE